MSRVLLLGVPRSGTTWCGRVLGQTDQTIYVNEPDGDTEAFALLARFGFKGPPSLSVGQSTEAYERLWQGAFDGAGRPQAFGARVARYLNASASSAERFSAWFDSDLTPRMRAVKRLAKPGEPRTDFRNVVVKSVRAEFTAEWIAERFKPTVLLVERSPMNVLASWIDLAYAHSTREFMAYAKQAKVRWGIRPPEDPTLLDRQVFTYAVMALALRESAEANNWLRVQHEYLCIDSSKRFQGLAGDLDLGWNENVERFIQDSNQSGEGYQTTRHTADQPESWRTRLDNQAVEQILHGLSRFPGLTPSGI